MLSNVFHSLVEAAGRYLAKPTGAFLWTSASEMDIQVVLDPPGSVVASELDSASIRPKFAPKTIAPRQRLLGYLLKICKLLKKRLLWWVVRW